MKRNEEQGKMGCGWYLNLLGGLATFGFAIAFAIWEVMEFGVGNPGVLALTMLFTVGPIVIVGLGVSIVLGKLAGG